MDSLRDARFPCVLRCSDAISIFTYFLSAKITAQFSDVFSLQSVDCLASAGEWQLLRLLSRSPLPRRPNSQLPVPILVYLSIIKDVFPFDSPLAIAFAFWRPCFEAAPRYLPATFSHFPSSVESPDGNYDDELLAGIQMSEMDPNQVETSSSSSRDVVAFRPVEPQAVELLLKQKPRGSKGTWIPMDVGERVRVSDRKAGKNLRLVFSALRGDLDLEKLRLFCFEKTTASSKKKASEWQQCPPTDFPELRRSTLPSDKPHVLKVVELEIKLLVMYRMVKFQAHIPSSDGPNRGITMESIEFITYNSGSEDSKKKKRAEQKRTPLLFVV